MQLSLRILMTKSEINNLFKLKETVRRIYQKTKIQNGVVKIMNLRSYARFKSTIISLKAYLKTKTKERVNINKIVLNIIYLK